MMEDIVILGVMPLETPRMMNTATMVARFDVRIGTIELRRCSLIHRPGRGYAVWGPSRDVTLDPSLANAVKAQVTARFEAMQ